MIRNILIFLKDWSIFSISIVIVILYIFFSSSIVTQQELSHTVVTNTLFSIINLLAAFHIARKVSLWGWKNETITTQKKLAKTAIRHNRGSLASILKLIKITREKIEIIQDDLTKQYVIEIKNHLEMIYNSLKNSEADFNEIVNEELKEENVLEIEISKILDDIQLKSNQLKELEENSAEKEDEIKDLKQQLQEKELELSTKVSSLPFGNTPIYNPSAYTPPTDFDSISGLRDESIEIILGKPVKGTIILDDEKEESDE